MRRNGHKKAAYAAYPRCVAAKTGFLQVFILLASLTVKSLNHLTESMQKVERLCAEIAEITNAHASLSDSGTSQAPNEGTPRQLKRKSKIVSIHANARPLT